MKKRYHFSQPLQGAGKYTRQNYKWIIGTLLTVITILVAIIVVPWGVSLASKAEDKKASQVLSTTQTFYFVPTTSLSLASIKDNADCWTFSDSSDRSDAYRCSLGNTIYDPCFYQSDLNYVDCPSSPAKHQVITVAKIEKNKAVPDNKRPPIPWYVQLENGIHCRYLSGATDVVADGRIDYGCDDETWLSLPLENKSDLLDIKCYNPHKERIELCKIREAWY